MITGRCRRCRRPLDRHCGCDQAYEAAASMRRATSDLQSSTCCAGRARTKTQTPTCVSMLSWSAKPNPVCKNADMMLCIALQQETTWRHQIDRSCGGARFRFLSVPITLPRIAHKVLGVRRSPRKAARGPWLLPLSHDRLPEPTVPANVECETDLRYGTLGPETGPSRATPGRAVRFEIDTQKWSIKSV